MFPSFGFDVLVLNAAGSGLVRCLRGCGGRRTVAGYINNIFSELKLNFYKSTVELEPRYGHDYFLLSFCLFIYFQDNLCTKFVVIKWIMQSNYISVYNQNI